MTPTASKARLQDAAQLVARSAAARSASAARCRPDALRCGGWRELGAGAGARVGPLKRTSAGVARLRGQICRYDAWSTRPRPPGPSHACCTRAGASAAQPPSGAQRRAHPTQPKRMRRATPSGPCAHARSAHGCAPRVQPARGARSTADASALPRAEARGGSNLNAACAWRLLGSTLAPPTLRLRLKMTSLLRRACRATTRRCGCAPQSTRRRACGSHAWVAAARVRSQLRRPRALTLPATAGGHGVQG